MRSKATILDIAREAGVSKSTVSLVLQGSSLIRAETATKVRRAIDEVTGGAAHPAQTIVGITGLAVPGCLIEIECTAVVDA